ncbi:hypothetical protein [Corallococcus sp. NCRR]|uniref:hypothetical protein n=1 Tax=Corallococcus sp. NCRR TaxID=2996782 RepID=UPI001A8D4444|nr:MULTISPECIES: hypothetical protein [unclassified Corallococcus]MBN9687102.1 hypothetical protein [Corallococcus sp. NCSPR001]WAS89070.1 hypothetical protein O0N60_19310 [Corallococcus sp. NCRR]
MTTCTDTTKYTEADVERWQSLIAATFKVERGNSSPWDALTHLRGAALEGAKVAGLVARNVEKEQRIGELQAQVADLEKQLGLKEAQRATAFRIGNARVAERDAHRAQVEELRAILTEYMAVDGSQGLFSAMRLGAVQERARAALAARPATNSPAVPDGSPPEPVSGAYTLPVHRMLSALDVRLPESDPYVARVTGFHEAMDLPVRHVPDVGTVEERVLAGKLLLEETLEFLRAMGLHVRARLDVGDYVVEVDPDSPGPDLVQMLHELGDAQYVVSGRAAQFGLPLLAAVTEEIHPANMRKLGPDGRPVRRADGKVIKPEGWVPADVSRVLRRAQEGRPTLPQRIDASLAKLGHELTPTGRLVASEVDAMLHPSGRCTCAGEGQCEWCRARCDACGVPESVRRAVVRVWSALRVTTPEQGAAVAVLRAVFEELPVPDGDEGSEAVKILTARHAALIQGALGMRKPPDALSYQDVVLMAQACKAALSDVMDRHDLPEPAKDRIALVHNSLVDVWQGVTFLQHLAGSAMVKAVRDAARLGAEDMRERAAQVPHQYGLLDARFAHELIRDLPLPGEEAPRG